MHSLIVLAEEMQDTLPSKSQAYYKHHINMLVNNFLAYFFYYKHLSKVFIQTNV